MDATLFLQKEMRISVSLRSMKQGWFCCLLFSACCVFCSFYFFYISLCASCSFYLSTYPCVTWGIATYPYPQHAAVSSLNDGLSVKWNSFLLHPRKGRYTTFCIQLVLYVSRTFHATWGVCWRFWDKNSSPRSHPLRKFRLSQESDTCEVRIFESIAQWTQSKGKLSIWPKSCLEDEFPKALISECWV